MFENENLCWNGLGPFEYTWAWLALAVTGLESTVDNQSIERPGSVDLAPPELCLHPTPSG
jgi:hypothetical protein